MEKVEHPDRILKKILKSFDSSYLYQEFTYEGNPSYGGFAEHYLERFIELEDFVSPEGNKYELLEADLEDEGYKKCYIIFSWKEFWNLTPLYYRLDFEYQSYDGYDFSDAKLYSVKRVEEQQFKYI